MAQKRILHVLSSVVYRGAENVACQIIHMFRNDPSIQFFYTSPDGVVRESLVEQGVDFRPMRAMTPGELRRVIKKVRPTLIHAHDMRASFVAALVCGSIPMISHIHINNIDSRTVTPKALAYCLAAQKAKKIFWVSPSAYDGYRFRDTFAAKSQVLQNVIDPTLLRQKAALDKSPERFDIIYVGALVQQKNPARLGRVLSGVVKKRPGTKCGVVGTGEELSQLEDVLHWEKTGDSIRLLGFQRNPYGMLKNASLMIMTSDYEGTPMCALEALALGVPIVSTPVDGMCDLVESGKNGLLCKEESELIDACISILDNPQQREQFHQEAARKAAEILNISAYKAEIEKAYAYSRS